MTKVSVQIQQLNILCFCSRRWTIEKQYYLQCILVHETCHYYFCQ